MQWPPWPFSSSEPVHPPRKAIGPLDQSSTSNSASPASSWTSPNLPLTWSYYTQPNVLIPTAVMTSTILVGNRLYLLYLRRIPEATRIGTSFWRRRSLLGRVTSVGDGDGFRLFHTPGGRLTGWGWLPWRQVPAGKHLKDQTISIRLAGIDAPETAHFGKPAQPGGQESLDWLTGYIHKRRVRAFVLRKDQYDRAIARVKIWRWFWRRDVGLEMLKRGLATVYEAKSGVEFGGEACEKKYRKAEALAKKKGKGIWAAKNGAGKWESPRDFKSRTKHEDGNL